jgi:hypothetical protein
MHVNLDLSTQGPDVALRRIFGRNRNEGIARWRKLHSEQFHNCYHALSIRMMKYRYISMSLDGHAVRMGE